ncbi:restriction endonuclease subunit S [Myroides odoratimimus]|uniref:restriction endonuclease subunit S n=1 Tax=Myroides odoratimimus TaxID=76832 RepID=UPI002577626B|nr:restriction endonuclease subunit S [Myroides odoratimimus]MDM1460477.1 restriction endonuclease subunit S [Myroides odoratimimus]
MRFPGFEGEWETKKLGEIATNVMYGINAAATNYDGENQYIRITDIDEQTRLFCPNPLSSPDGELDNKYLLHKGDILFARTGASVGKSYLYNDKDGKVYFAGFLIRLNVKAEDPYFIFSQTLTEKYQRWVLTMSMRSGQPGINAEEYKLLPIVTPSIQEQEKISSFLLLIDERIQTQNKIIEELEVLKTSVSKKIFSQQLRFQDNGNVFSSWKKYKLKNIANRIVEKNSENNQNVLTISAQHGLISQLEFFNKSVAAKNILGYYLLKKNDFAYNKSYSNGYPMGAIKRLNKYDKGVVSTLYICFEFNHSVNKDFMEHYFESGIQNSEIEKVAQEGARNHGLLNIGVSDFFDITINLPSIDEQKVIANFLSSLVSKIENEKQTLSQLNLQKQFLLKELFI